MLPTVLDTLAEIFRSVSQHFLSFCTTWTGCSNRHHDVPWTKQSFRAEFLNLFFAMQPLEQKVAHIVMSILSLTWILTAFSHLQETRYEKISLY